MYAEERRIKIIAVLSKDKTVDVNKLAHTFGVSGATIRSDLHNLERTGILTRTHGGAIEATKTGFESDMGNRAAEHLAAKQKIARSALAQIEEGATIALDTGTTTLELARCLFQRRRLTVVTNDILIARVLETATGVQTILLGGVIRKGFHCTVGPGTTDPAAAAKLTVDKAFMAANSFALANGATTPDIQQAEAKKRLMAMSSKIFLLCDKSKFGKVSFAQFARVNDIHVLITDFMSGADCRSCKKRGLQVIVAS